MRGSRWDGPAALLLVVVLGASAFTSCGAGDGAGQDPGGGAPIRAEYHADEYGVTVAIKVGYPEEREVTGARLLAGDESTRASLYPLDGTDPDGQPSSITLAPDEQVSLEGALLVPCSGEHDAPVFEVVSRADGVRVTDLFQPSNADGYQQAVREWCDRSITMSVSGMRSTPQGDHELRVQFSNPGPEPVTVTSEEVDDGTSTWQAASMVVPAGITQLTIHGHGPSGCAAPPPWESGHVRADGEVIRPEPDASAATSAEGC